MIETLEQDLMTVTQVAEQTGFTSRWIRSLCDRGRDFPHATKLGGEVWLIPRRDVEVWLEQRRQQEAMDAGESLD